MSFLSRDPQKKLAPYPPRCSFCNSGAAPMALYDADLGGMVCDSCRKDLRAADAWLKAAGMPQCNRKLAQG